MSKKKPKRRMTKLASADRLHDGRVRLNYMHGASGTKFCCLLGSRQHITVAEAAAALRQPTMWVYRAAWAGKVKLGGTGRHALLRVRDLAKLKKA